MLPLSSKTILVTRSLGQANEFSRLLREQGADVLEMPVLEICPPSSWQGLDQAIAQLANFDWLILTSANAVDYFFERLAQQGRFLPPSIQTAVVGQKTALRLQHYGIQPGFIPTSFIADVLVSSFPEDDLQHKAILFPRVETGGREVLVQEFRAKGAIVTEVAAYESGCVKTIDPAILEALRSGRVDVVTFASSKTVHCFYQLLHTVSEPPTRYKIVSIGPQTSAACRQWLRRVDLEAATYTLEGLTEAIVDWAKDSSQIS